MARRKGQHEETVEFAKDLLEKGVGMGEITEKTGLREEQVKKVMDKMEKKLND